MSEQFAPRGRRDQQAIDHLLADSGLSGDDALRTELLELRSLASTAPLPSDAVRALMVSSPVAATQQITATQPITATQQITTTEGPSASSGAPTAVLATVAPEPQPVDELAARRRKKRRTAVAGLGCCRVLGWRRYGCRRIRGRIAWRFPAPWSSDRFGGLATEPRFRQCSPTRCPRWNNPRAGPSPGSAAASSCHRPTPARTGRPREPCRCRSSAAARRRTVAAHTQDAHTKGARQGRHPHASGAARDPAGDRPFQDRSLQAWPLGHTCTGPVGADPVASLEALTANPFPARCFVVGPQRRSGLGT